MTVVTSEDATEDEAHDESSPAESLPSEPTDVHLVGEATADALADAEFDATGIPEKTVSYAMLKDAGVNPGVAGRIRRAHSLPWSFGGDDESLERRSDQIRGLQAGEREWVAASGGDWASAEASTAADASADAQERAGVEASTDGSGSAEAAESAWRERARPDPVTDVPAVDEEAAAILAEAGVTSLRSLATADPVEVADSLDLDPERVTAWRDAAHDRT